MERKVSITAVGQNLTANQRQFTANVERVHELIHVLNGLGVNTNGMNIASATNRALFLTEDALLPTTDNNGNPDERIHIILSPKKNNIANGADFEEYDHMIEKAEAMQGFEEFVESVYGVDFRDMQIDELNDAMIQFQTLKRVHKKAEPVLNNEQLNAVEGGFNHLIGRLEGLQRCMAKLGTLLGDLDENIGSDIETAKALQGAMQFTRDKIEPAKPGYHTLDEMRKEASDVLDALDNI